MLRVALRIGLWLAAPALVRVQVRGESMRPTLEPGDRVLVVRRVAPWTRLVRPRAGRVALVRLPWEHDRTAVKRLVAGPGRAWSDGVDSVPAGPGWAVVGDQRVLSTDSRHHGRLPDASVLGVVVYLIEPEGRAGRVR